MPANLRVGSRAERLAEFYLKKHGGLRLVKRNYSCYFGEIDLIMTSEDALVFVEVRFRKSDYFGGSALSVTPAKQRRLIKTAQNFLIENARYSEATCRFDVMAMSGVISHPEYQWIPDAFSVPDSFDPY